MQLDRPEGLPVYLPISAVAANKGANDIAVAIKVSKNYGPLSRELQVMNGNNQLLFDFLLTRGRIAELVLAPFNTYEYAIGGAFTHRSLRAQAEIAGASLPLLNDRDITRYAERLYGGARNRGMIEESIAAVKDTLKVSQDKSIEEIKAENQHLKGIYDGVAINEASLSMVIEVKRVLEELKRTERPFNDTLNNVLRLLMIRGQRALLSGTVDVYSLFKQAAPAV